MIDVTAGLRSNARSSWLRVTDRVLECHAFNGEQQRTVERLIPEPLRAEALRLGGARDVERMPSLTERDDPRDGGDDERQREPEHAGLEASAAARFGRGARGQERTLLLVELVLVQAAPLERSRQPPAAVQVVARTAGVGPGACRIRHVAVDAPALRVVHEPVVQPRPLAEQRFVRHLHLPLGDRQQPPVGEQVDDRELGAAFGQLHPAALERSVLRLGHEPQQDPAGHVALRRLEPVVRVLGEPRDRGAHAADLLVRGAANRRPSRRRQRSSSAVDSSGSAPGSPATSATSRSVQPGLDLEARALGRQLDRLPQLLHRIGGTSTWPLTSSSASSG